MRDQERGVVWEESIVMAPKNSRFVFLSATVPNAKEFADWVAKVDLLEPVSHFLGAARGNLASENATGLKEHRATNFCCVPLQIYALFARTGVPSYSWFNMVQCRCFLFDSIKSRMNSHQMPENTMLYGSNGASDILQMKILYHSLIEQRSTTNHVISSTLIIGPHRFNIICFLLEVMAYTCDCLQAILLAAQSSPVAFSWGFSRFVNIRDGKGATPLHLTARQRQPGFSEEFIFLHPAKGGNLHCIRELPAWGADWLQRDEFGLNGYCGKLYRGAQNICSLILF